MKKINENKVSAPALAMSTLSTATACSRKEKRNRGKAKNLNIKLFSFFQPAKLQKFTKNVLKQFWQTS